MCFHLFLASPLTLSEVRAMLPPGLTSDLLEPAEQRALRGCHPAAQTAARLLHGACACDLVLQRHPVSRVDEAGLRRRYRQLGLSRDRTIAALANHRRALEHRPEPQGHWPRAVAAFAAEHARNAGPTLYYLHFSHDGALGVLPEEPPLAVSAAQLRREPGTWLVEERLVLVVP